MIDAREEQIRILSKHLKLPTVANYMDIIRQCKPDADFSDILLELLTAEVNSRREEQQGSLTGNLLMILILPNLTRAFHPFLFTNWLPASLLAKRKTSS